MPNFPHLRLVRPAGQLIELETPNRLALRGMLNATSLPDAAALSESDAGILVSAGASAAKQRFGLLYCQVPPGVDFATWQAAHPWCLPEFTTVTPTTFIPPTAPPTPNRDALQARLRVPSLPPVSMLSEALAGTISNADYYAQFCLPITGADGVVRYSPWCGPDYRPAPPPLPGTGPAPGTGTPPTPDTGPAIPGSVVPPLIPGYGAGRIPPIQHYPTWIGTGYVLGDEKNFLLGLPPDEYYRLVDKLPLGGPVLFHGTVRVEATRRGLPDPLVGVPNLETVIAAQQTDWLGRTVTIQQPTPTPAPKSSAWKPVALVAGVGLVAWFFWPKSKPAGGRRATDRA